MKNKNNNGFPAEMRKQLGLSQSELAHFLGVSKAMIAMSEAHERQIAGGARVEAVKLDMMYDGDTPLHELEAVRQFEEQDEKYGRPVLEKELDKARHQLKAKKRAYNQARTEKEDLLRRLHAYRKALEHIDHPPKAELHDYWRMGHLDRSRKEEFFKEKQQDIREKLNKYDTCVMAMKKADLLALDAKVAYLEGVIS